jgi:hypothetical protein
MVNAWRSLASSSVVACDIVPMRSIACLSGREVTITRVHHAPLTMARNAATPRAMIVERKARG